MTQESTKCCHLSGGYGHEWWTRKLYYRKDYRMMHMTAQSDNTHMVCC